MYKINSKVDKPDTRYLYQQIVNMMTRGIKVGNLAELYRMCVNDQNAYLKDIQTKYGIANPNSSAQVIAYLEDLNDPNIVEACAPQGKWTSNKAALQTVESLGYEVGGDIINYRTAKKYADSIKGMMDVMDSKGFIHPQVSLTKTNRISYKNPAIMNIPKELLWDAVVPTEPGNVLISADIKNQEPNILINMNNIESLKPALYADTGLYEAIFNQIPVWGRMNIIFDDEVYLHGDTQKKTPFFGVIDNMELKIRGIQPIFYTPKLAPFGGIMVGNKEVRLIDVINFVCPTGKIPELPNKISVITSDDAEHEVDIKFNVDFSKTNVKKAMKNGGIIEVDGLITGVTLKCEGIVRKEFKRAWNAMTYGASKPGVKAMCKNIDGGVIYDFFTKIPELQEYRSMCTKLANAGCQEIETYFGTKLFANEYNSKALKRVLLDLPIQGTAADILSLLVKHFNEEVKKRGYSGLLSIYYTRHDELIIEASKNLIDTISMAGVLAEIRDIVEHQVDDWVPFKLEIEPVMSVDLREIISNNSDED